ncbi:MAG: hypothetical protein R2799_12895 [Crocinitomicaceae bacterium]
MKNLIIISLLFLFSCAKDGKNIYIEGKVVNPVTGQPIEGIRLVLHKMTSDLGSGSSSVIKDESYSDINGNFTLSHNGSLFNNYIVLVEYPNEGYHLVGWKDATGQNVGGYQLDVKKGELMDVRLELLEYCDVFFSYDNINCYNGNDSLFLDVRSAEYIVTDGYYIKVVGCNTFTSGPVKIPQGTYTLSGIIKRGGVSTNFNSIQTIWPDSVNTFEIFY